MEREQYFSIGELSKRMGTTVRTLQYYDKENLLKPSALSEGGRRLYSKKDLLLLHQIQSLKYLGFSLEEIKKKMIPLNTTKEVLAVLRNQRDMIHQQINDLSKARAAIDILMEESEKMDCVDFQKYADIIQLIRMNNEGYWVVKLFDDDLMTHIKRKYMEHPQEGVRLYEEWKHICEVTSEYEELGILPESEEGQAMAKRWWDMVLEFTGGDMSLLPKLFEFSNNKSQWDETMKQMQEKAEKFIEKALEIYFKNNSLDLDETIPSKESESGR